MTGYVCVCVCVCVRERERECVCVCECVSGSAPPGVYRTAVHPYLRLYSLLLSIFNPFIPRLLILSPSLHHPSIPLQSSIPASAVLHLLSLLFTPSFHPSSLHFPPSSFLFHPFHFPGFLFSPISFLAPPVLFLTSLSHLPPNSIPQASFTSSSVLSSTCLNSHFQSEQKSGNNRHVS